MKRLYSCLLFIFLFSCQSLFAQFPEKDRTAVMEINVDIIPAGNKNGFILTVPMRYCIIDCFGEIYLWIAQIPKGIKSNGYYRYEGQDREIRKFVPGFDKDTYDKFSPYIDLDVVISDQRGSAGGEVAKIWAFNIISWDFGGCLGQTYPLVPDGRTTTNIFGEDASGYTNQQLRDKLKQLRIERFTIREAYCQDSEIEEAIRQKLQEEKNKAKKNQLDSFYNEYLKEANANLAQKEYEKAKAKFKQASDLKKNESYPISKIAEIDKILEKQKAKIKFDKLVAEGDAYTSNDNKYEARKTFREALTIVPNDPVVLSKIEALGKDNIEDKLAEVKRLTNNLQVFVQGFTQWECSLFLGSGAGNYFKNWDISSHYYKTSFDYGVNKIFIENADQKNITNVIILPLIDRIEILVDYPVKEFKWCGSTPEVGGNCEFRDKCGFLKPVEYLGISLYDKNTRDVRFLVKAEDAEKVAELLREAAIASGAKPFEVTNSYKENLERWQKGK